MDYDVFEFVKIYIEQGQTSAAGVLLLKIGNKLTWAKKPDEAVIFFQASLIYTCVGSVYIFNYWQTSFSVLLSKFRMW